MLIYKYVLVFYGRRMEEVIFIIYVWLVNEQWRKFSSSNQYSVLFGIVIIGGLTRISIARHLFFYIVNSNLP